MASIEGLSKEELKELILEEIRDLGLDPETIEVEILKGPKVVLRGKVDSGVERALIKQTIMDIVGIDEVIDELMAIRGADETPGEEGQDKYDLYEQDEEFVGTEDPTRAVEDGIPYIPPTSPSFQEATEKPKRKRKPKAKE